MTVPRRYFRQAEFNGYLKPLLGCNISFYHLLSPLIMLPEEIN